MEQNTNNDEFSELKNNLGASAHTLQVIKDFNLPSSDIDKLFNIDSFEDRVKMAKDLAETHKRQSAQAKHSEELHSMINQRNKRDKEYTDYRDRKTGLWSK
ncbi:MAG: hypothetical protein LKJ22_07515 [Liquorilactobacillus nagelii]|jgi:hypothetical protein|uniref:hypothetical protein n=1 Tax=Liquorilactobacillus nagelii TaxID=82688 RepID=UPI002430DD76|nr:hypothetical protein [Liquorilactobacillus nagelii]MCI1921761.1 hypothetical protein [Liquorilactobacillus nagelii]MCI1976711.1 hypothetical protein [Liquorilactobacillus nagelii]